MTLGNRVKQIRQRLGMTQKEFGERIGVTAVTISTTENGKTHPDAQTIKVICNEFKIRRMWLEEGIGPMELPELDTEDLEIEMIFSRQTQEEVEAIKWMLDQPGGRQAFAHFAMLFKQNMEAMNAEKE